MTEITIQHFNDCPNWLDAVARMEQVVDQSGIEAIVRLQLIRTTEEAEAHDFRGSPTILIDGRDPWSDPDAPVGLSCRLYRTEEGFRGSPSVEQIEAALLTIAPSR